MAELLHSSQACHVHLPVRLHTECSSASCLTPTCIKHKHDLFRVAHAAFDIAQKMEGGPQHVNLHKQVQSQIKAESSKRDAALCAAPQWVLTLDAESGP